jgi:hypothetical protein
LDESVALTLDYRRRNRLAIQLSELWFMVEQFKLTGCSSVEQVNNSLGSGRKVSWFGIVGATRNGRGLSAIRRSVGHQSGQRDLSDSKTAIAKKVPPSFK